MPAPYTYLPLLSIWTPFLHWTLCHLILITRRIACIWPEISPCRHIPVYKVTALNIITFSSIYRHSKQTQITYKNTYSFKTIKIWKGQFISDLLQNKSYTWATRTTFSGVVSSSMYSLSETFMPLPLRKWRRPVSMIRLHWRPILSLSETLSCSLNDWLELLRKPENKPLWKTCNYGKEYK